MAQRDGERYVVVVYAVCVGVCGTNGEDFEAAGMYEDDLSPDHRAGHEAGYFEGQGCSRC